MIGMGLLLTVLIGQEPCLVDGQRIRGELRFVETQHPNGTVIRSAFLVSPLPFCVEDEYGRTEGRWVQVSPAEGVSFAGIPPGSTIVVEAELYFTPTTAWHIGDIVALRSRVVGMELQ